MPRLLGLEDVGVEKMKKCPKCDGKGGIMWITSAGTDAQWDYCEKCGGTGEVKDDKKVQ